MHISCGLSTPARRPDATKSHRPGGRPKGTRFPGQIPSSTTYLAQQRQSWNRQEIICRRPVRENGANRTNHPQRRGAPHRPAAGHRSGTHGRRTSETRGPKLSVPPGRSTRRTMPKKPRHAPPVLASPPPSERRASWHADTPTTRPCAVEVRRFILLMHFELYGLGAGTRPPTPGCRRSGSGTRRRPRKEVSGQDAVPDAEAPARERVAGWGRIRPHPVEHRPQPPRVLKSNKANVKHCFRGLRHRRRSLDRSPG